MPEAEQKSDWQQWFERVWEYREETLYPSLFGSARRGIFPISAEMITGMFQQPDFDPRWLHYGVFEFEPTPVRASWLYVTSGMSNAWEADRPDPDSVSGLGCEFIFESTEQGDWAILRLLHLMTFQILLCHGRYPGRGPMNDFDRVPLRQPICPGNTVLTHLMLAPPAQLPRETQLESDKFDFYSVVGIAESEAAFACAEGGDVLLTRLTAAGFFPVTNSQRSQLDV